MLQLMRFLLILLIVLLSVQFCYAEEVDNKIVPTESEQSIRLISPIGTMVRSTVFPGWGQFHSRNYFRGSLVLLGIGGSVVGTFLAHQSFTKQYDNYVTTAGYDPDDPAVLVSYDKANQRYKLKMFFIYTGIGVWVYSIIDSYVSANFYNATSQIRSIREDAQYIEKLGLQVGITPSRLYLGVVKTF